MASKKKKQISEKQRELNRQYYNARRNYIRNIKSLEDRGYDVSALNIPDKPQKITEGSIRKIKELNEKRYKKSSFEIIDTETGDFKTISGTEARKIERKVAAQVGRSLDNYIDKHYNEDVYYDPSTGEILDEKQAQAYTGNIPLVKTKYAEIEKASFKQRKTMSAKDYEITYFNSIINYFEDYTVYTGTKKSSKKQIANARHNAETIIDFLKGKFADNPTATVNAIGSLGITSGQLTSRLFLYADTGAEAFVTAFFNVFNEGVDADSLSDLNDESDIYDEED